MKQNVNWKMIAITGKVKQMTNTLHSYKSKGDMYAHSLGYLFEEKDWINIKQALILYTNTVIDLEDKLAEQAERVTEGNGSEVSLETEAQEPVAWILTEADGTMDFDCQPTIKPTQNDYDALREGETFTPLYAAPVRTKDLTDDEIAAIAKERATLHGKPEGIAHDFAHAVIAAYKEKNK